MSKKLYVGNLPYSTTEESLSEFFAQAGTVDAARVITDRDTGRSKGFGFVEMSSEEAAEKARHDLNGKELDGRPLTVNEARPPQPRYDNGGYEKRAGGGGRGRY